VQSLINWKFRLVLVLINSALDTLMDSSMSFPDVKVVTRAKTKFSVNQWLHLYFFLKKHDGIDTILNIEYKNHEEKLCKTKTRKYQNHQRQQNVIAKTSKNDMQRKKQFPSPITFITLISVVSAVYELVVLVCVLFVLFWYITFCCLWRFWYFLVLVLQSFSSWFLYSIFKMVSVLSCSKLSKLCLRVSPQRI
jgi:hypothetical protein